MDAVILVGAIALGCWGVAVALTWLLEDVPPKGVRALSRAVADRRRVPPTVGPEDGVLLELELARIAGRLQAEYAARQPATAERIQGWSLAYDRVLLELCHQEALPAPRAVPPLSRAERFAVERALMANGRSW